MGEKPISDSASSSGEGGSSGGFFCAGVWFARDDARLVELEVDEEVESSGISTTFHVCNVASGANDTRRFAVAVCQLNAKIGKIDITNPWISGAPLFAQGSSCAPAPVVPSLPALSPRPSHPGLKRR